MRCARPISYCVPAGDQPAPLVYFLQNIFRKRAFREGQIDILKRTLTRQNVIAALEKIAAGQKKGRAAKQLAIRRAT